MSSLRERFAAAEKIPAPDLWDDVQWRTVSGPEQRLVEPSVRTKVATILVAFAIFAAVVLVFGRAFRASIDAPVAPAPTSSVHAPRPAPVRVGGDLPTTFPATLGLPAGTRPVASRACCGYVQVWFRTELGRDELGAFYADALRRDGWTSSGRETTNGGGWRYYGEQAANQRTAIVLGGPHDASYPDGSDAFEGRWNLYIIVYG